MQVGGVERPNLGSAGRTWPGRKTTCAGRKRKYVLCKMAYVALFKIMQNLHYVAPGAFPPCGAALRAR